MKATGIVRRVDELGRVVIPKELRRTIGIKEGDPLEIYVDGKDVIFRRYHIGCEICRSTDDLLDVGDVRICRDCARKIVRAANE